MLSLTGDELAEALRRRRVRTRAFQTWVRAAHGSVLLQLAARLALQSAACRAWRRWRRHMPLVIPPPSPLSRSLPRSGDCTAFGHVLSPCGEPSHSLFREVLRWREAAAALKALHAASARLCFNRDRRALRRSLRCWRGVHRSHEQCDGHRRLALRAALRSTTRRDLTVAVATWRVALATWQATAYAASGDGMLREPEAAYDVARGLRAELGEEQVIALMTK